MYATFVLRDMDPAKRSATLALAEREFFPTLQQAPGFCGFMLVQVPEGKTLGIAFWNTAAQAEAFEQTLGARWQARLTELGHRLVDSGRGEVLEIPAIA